MEVELLTYKSTAFFFNSNLRSASYARSHESVIKNNTSTGDRKGMVNSVWLVISAWAHRTRTCNLSAIVNKERQRPAQGGGLISTQSESSACAWVSSSLEPYYGSFSPSSRMSIWFSCILMCLLPGAFCKPTWDALRFRLELLDDVGTEDEEEDTEAEVIPSVNETCFGTCNSLDLLCTRGCAMGEQDLEAAACVDLAIVCRRFVLGFRLGRSFLVREQVEIHPL